MSKANYIVTANRACALIFSFIREHTRDGGVWLLPVNVCPDVPLTFCEAKVAFEFVDINPKTLCIDEEESVKLISASPSKYSGVIYVRTYGFLSNTTSFFRKLHSVCPSISVIDDRCLCLPEFSPKFFGADMVVYSTGHCKQIDLGIGGFAHYRQFESLSIASDLIYDGTDEEYMYKEAYNHNRPLDIIPTGWLKIDYFDEPYEYWKKIETRIQQRVRQRRVLNAIYCEGLIKSIQLPEQYQSWRFNIRVPVILRDSILAELFANNCFASVHYHSANRLFDNRRYHHSDNLYASVINLFNDDYYTEEMAHKTVEIINKKINNYDSYSIQQTLPNR